MEAIRKEMAVASFETEFHNLLEKKKDDEKHAKSQATWSVEIRTETSRIKFYRVST